MSNNNNQFTPEQVDEQIDQLLHRAPNSSNKFLIDDLQHMYQEDLRSLKKVQQRLGLQGEMPLYIEQAQEPISVMQVQKHQSKKRNYQMYQVQKKPIMHAISIIVPAAVMAIIIGSLVFVFALSRHNATTRTGSFTNLQQSAVSSQAIYAHDINNLYKLDAQTSKVLWTLPFKYTLKVVSAGSSIYALQLQSVIAVDANSGKLLWSHTFTNTGAVDMIYAKDMLYVSTEIGSNENVMPPTSSGQIYVLNAHDGSQNTTYPSTDGTWGLAIENGILAVGAGEGLAAYDTASGKQIWHVSSQAPVNTPARGISIVNGVVYAIFLTNDKKPIYAPGKKVTEGTYTSYIAAYQTRSGQQVWKSQDFTGTNITGLAVDHHNVYFVAMNEPNLGKGVAYAYDTQQNKQLWRHDLDAISVQNPVLSNGVVYIITEGSTNKQAQIIAFNATTGAVQWQRTLKNESTSAPSIANGMLYIGSATSTSKSRFPISRSLDAFKASDGSQVWTNTHFSTKPTTIPAQ